MEETFLALDFGSGQISAVLSIYDDHTDTCRVRLSTRKSCPSVSACYILDFDKTVNTLTELLAEVSEYAKFTPTLVVGLRGDFVSFCRCNGDLALNANSFITQKEINAVLDESLPKTFSEDMEVVPLLPQRFLLDGQERANPQGLTGNWLEADCFASGVLSSHLTNLNRVLAAVGYEDCLFIPTILTLCDTLIKPEEKQGRTLLLDIGGQYSAAALFHKGILEGAWEIPLGAEQITQEVADVLQIDLSEAQKMLKDYEYGEDEVMDDVLDEAARTLVNKLHRELVQALPYIKYPPQQAVLTGGGANLALRNALKNVLGVRRVRLASHDGLIADSEDMLAPAYTSALSLSLYSQQHGSQLRENPARCAAKGLIDKLLTKFGFNS